MLAVLALMAAAVGATILVMRSDGDSAPEKLTSASAQSAIQNYLDALQRGDTEEIARHTLCGLFDAVKEKRSDLALADLSSDAFRKQFGKAEVTSIDKMVFSSPYQAQVLFTHERHTRRQPHPPCTGDDGTGRWLRYSSRTTRSWCARICCARQASTRLS